MTGLALLGFGEPTTTQGSSPRSTPEGEHLLTWRSYGYHQTRPRLHPVPLRRLYPQALPQREVADGDALRLSRRERHRSEMVSPVECMGLWPESPRHPPGCPTGPPSGRGDPPVPRPEPARVVLHLKPQRKRLDKLNAKVYGGGMQKLQHLKCPTCRTPFWRTRKDRKFCSRACATKAWVKRAPRGKGATP
jgi:hypothetical protein